MRDFKRYVPVLRMVPLFSEIELRSSHRIYDIFASLKIYIRNDTRRTASHQQWLPQIIVHLDLRSRAKWLFERAKIRSTSFGHIYASVGKI